MWVRQLAEVAVGPYLVLSQDSSIVRLLYRDRRRLFGSRLDHGGKVSYCQTIAQHVCLGHAGSLDQCVVANCHTKGILNLEDDFNEVQVVGARRCKGSVRPYVYWLYSKLFADNRLDFAQHR